MPLPAQAISLSFLRSNAHISARRTFTSASGPKYICGCHHSKNRPEGISFELFLPSTWGSLGDREVVQVVHVPERKFAICADSSARKLKVSESRYGLPPFQ